MNDFTSISETDDLNEQETLALIAVANAKDFVWHVPPMNSGSTILRPIQIRATTGGTLNWTNNKVDGQNFIIAPTGASANRIAEYAYTCGTVDDPLETKLNPGSDVVKHWDERTNRIECFMGNYLTRTNATATTYVGLEFGTCDSGAPLPEAVATTNAVVQLRWQASTDSWFVYCNLGDGATPGESTPLTGVTGTFDSTNVPHGVHAALEWDPINLLVRAYINGKLGATVSGASVPTAVSGGISGTSVISGVFYTTGSSASTILATLHFSGFKHIVKDFLAGVL